MKFLSVLFCFLFLFQFCLSGKDDLDLIQEQLSKLQVELKDIDNIELGSQRYNEVKVLLNDFEDTAIRLQKNVRTLPYMNDIRCADCAKSIRATAQSAIGMHKKILETDPSGKSVLAAKRLSPVQALDIILKDIEGMNEVKFSPVTMKTGIEKEYLCWYQFVRCYAFCKNERKNLKKNIKNPVWKEIYVERAAIMQDLAEKMTGYLLQRYGKEIKNSRLDSAVKDFRSDLLRTATEDDIVTLDDRSRKTLRGFGTSDAKTNLKKKKKDDDPVARIDLVIRVVRKDMAEKKKQKEKAEKEKKEAEAAELKEREKQEKQAERRKRKEEEKKAKEQKKQEKREQLSEQEDRRKQGERFRRLNRASDEEISAELAQIYTKYFPGDEQSSLPEKQKQDCMDRMSDKQKKLFESTRARLAREGVNKDSLDLETLKEIRPLLNTRNYQPDRKTAIELILREDSEK